MRSSHGIFLVLLLAMLPPPADAFDRDQDELDVNIQMSSTWSGNVKGSSIAEKGSALLTLSGTLKRTGKRTESLEYGAKSLTATYRWQRQYINKLSCADCCPPGALISVEEAVGSRQVPEDDFRMRVYLGDLGNQVARRRGCRDEVDGVYEFEYNLHFDTKVRDGGMGCKRFPPPGVNQQRNLGVSGHRLLGPGGMYGTYGWKSLISVFPLEFEPHIVHYCGAPRLYPDPPLDPENFAKLNVHWQIGEAKPVIRILHHRGGEARDITDAPPRAVHVIVGEKVKLEAQVLPPFASVSEGRWRLTGDVFADYRTSEKEGKLELLEYDASQQKTIEFFWQDGKLGGVPLQVFYTAQAKDGEIEGESELWLYEPEVEVKSIPAKEYTVGLTEEGCQLYLGRTVQTETGEWAGAPPGMIFEAETTMPAPFAEHPYTLAYAQLMKEDNRRQQVTYGNDGNDYSWERAGRDKTGLDTRFPYGGSPGPKMDDTPGTVLGNSTDEIHLIDHFETYLMFRPCPKATGGPCAWVPLKKMEWDLRAGAKRIGDIWRERTEMPCDKKTFHRCYGIPPRPKPKDAEEHPEWCCNVEDLKKWTDIPQQGWSQDAAGKCPRKPKPPG